ncbi:uncharacterized protein LOC103314982 [Tribolium castaneum]|nr:PREDICTED: uncharacterized protein LOC103314982 isoform X1 [Tribolium castaneum]|eukprot:XP_015838322.1 PREDICTED: uncharacterized protein LOC103314982 isoform X1 [Tribolium castaneum]
MAKKFRSDDISADPLRLLWLGQMHPFSPFRRSVAFLVMNVSACWLLAALAIKGIITSYKNDIFFVAECLQTCNLMFHGIGKFVNLFLHRDNLKKLLKNRSKFWKIDDFQSEEIYQELSEITSTVKKGLRYYYCGVVVVMLLFDLQPFATGSLPSGCYVPEGWFKSLTVMTWLLSLSFLNGVQGMDGFFCSISISIVIQFKMLTHRFKNMRLFHNESERKMWKELKELVDYHNFLTSYCKLLNTIFASIFLLQFLVSIISASVSIFIFMQPGAWSNRIKFILYYLAVVAETSFYCVPAEIIVNSASEIGYAVSELDWYKIRINQIKKCFVIILARTQRTMVFTGYGLVNMNLQTFVVYVKTVFSFYTYINSVRKIEK